MSTPQDPPVRNKQKRRRTKKLAAWRAKQAEKAGTAAKADAPAKKTAAKKAPAKKTAAK
ncbi:MAG: hypothetical protein U0169_08040 [Polyangiaceae bacterium]